MESARLIRERKRDWGRIKYRGGNSDARLKVRSGWK